MFRQSIKWRLQAWQGLLLVGVLSGFGVTAYQLQRSNQLRLVDQELQQRVSMIITEMRVGRAASRSPFRRSPDGLPPGPDGEGRQGFAPPPRELRLAPAVAALFEGGETNAPYYVVWLRNGNILKRSPAAPDSVTLPARTASIAETPSRQRGMFREIYHFTPPGECVLVGRSIAAERAELRCLGWLLAGAGGLVLFLGLAGGWWMAARAFRPIEEISATASRISGGNLAERISVADTDGELGRLAAVLNSTFARLEDAFAQQQRFTADASHELRTPVSVLLAQTQSALARERPAAEYRETLEACQNAAQRMRGLIESLLALARLDAGQDEMERVPFDLARTAAECVEHVRPLAAGRSIQLHADLAPAKTVGDAGRVAQVITNLLTNAIHYNTEAGEVRVATRVESGRAVLTVSDTGPGIAADHLPHIFERFYRADQARTTSRGRAGLGLAISRAIVEAHAGVIDVVSPPEGGAIFTVRLPGNGREIA